MKKVSFLFLIGLAFGLYAFLLDRTPVHLNQDELGFSSNAYSVAKSGLDENGRFFPLYFWHLGVMWATPYIVYLTALVLKFLPLSEFAIRLPSVLVGVANVILIYLLAEKIFKSKKWAFIAGLLLATTPIHFIQSRILLDNNFIIPFVLFWLLCLVYFWETKKPLFVGLTGLILGLGFYSYHAGRILMPFYVLTTFLFLFPEIKRNFKLLILLLIGFSLPLLPLIPWTRQYPDTLFLDQARYVGIVDRNGGQVSAGIASLFSSVSLSHRLDVFISYFNPVFLFLLGDASLIHSTSLHHPLGLASSVIRAGVFLLPLAIFIPLGIHSAVKKKDRLAWLLIFGFFSAPISGALAGDHWRYSRILIILPFAILLAVYGIKFMLSQKKKLFRVACYLLLLLVPLQFSYFFYDYFTAYRIRSYNWMKYNIPGALETVISEELKTPASTIYLDNRVGFIDRYWKFYLVKHGRLDLLEKTELIDVREADFDGLVDNSILVSEFNNVDGQKAQIGQFKKTRDIFEPDGVSVFYIFRN